MTDFELGFRDFVRKFGGEVLPEIHTARNADYLFREQNVIAELKVLEKDATTDYSRKMQRLARKWTGQGLLHVFGRAVIELPKVPPKCQREWLEVLKRPIENIVRDANEQIGSTRQHSKVPNAQGLLLVANDRNFLHRDAKAFLTLVAHVLKKKDERGTPRFPNIHAVSFFSCRVTDGNFGTPFWAPGHLETADARMHDFQEKLANEFFKYVFHVRDLVRDAQKIKIDVKVNYENGVQTTVENRFCCNVANCGQTIAIYTDGPETIHNFVCPMHGKVASFSSYAAFLEATKIAVNKVLDARGHDLITDDSDHYHA